MNESHRKTTLKNLTDDFSVCDTDDDDDSD